MVELVRGGVVLVEREALRTRAALIVSGCGAVRSSKFGFARFDGDKLEVLKVGQICQRTVSLFASVFVVETLLDEVSFSANSKATSLSSFISWITFRIVKQFKFSVHDRALFFRRSFFVRLAFGLGVCSGIF